MQKMWPTRSLLGGRPYPADKSPIHTGFGVAPSLLSWLANVCYPGAHVEVGPRFAARRAAAR